MSTVPYQIKLLTYNKTTYVLYSQRCLRSFVKSRNMSPTSLHARYPLRQIRPISLPSATCFHRSDPPIRTHSIRAGRSHPVDHSTERSHAAFRPFCDRAVDRLEKEQKRIENATSRDAVWGFMSKVFLG